MAISWPRVDHITQKMSLKFWPRFDHILATYTITLFLLTIFS